jgi:hypothetical protein
MEGIARLVSESVARQAIDCTLDDRCPHWSRWFPCETSFDLMLVPTRPGLFAIAEELIAPREAAAHGGKRLLAMSQAYATEDLAITMSHLVAVNNSRKDGVAPGRIFARFTIFEDDHQRPSAQTAFQRWLMTSAAAGSGRIHDWDDFAEVPSSATESEPERRTPTEGRSEGRAANVPPPAPLPSGF